MIFFQVAQIGLSVAVFGISGYDNYCCIQNNKVLPVYQSNSLLMCSLS